MSLAAANFEIGEEEEEEEKEEEEERQGRQAMARSDQPGKWPCCCCWRKELEKGRLSEFRNQERLDFLIQKNYLVN